MRAAVFALLCGVVACQEPNTRVTAVTVQWMDWPAEVNAGQPFRTRLVVWGVCALNPQFRAGASADQSAVTFAPYFLLAGNDRIACLTERATASFALIAVDTAGTAPGLAAAAARSYEMRGSTTDIAYIGRAQALPVGTFGKVTVRPSGADLSRRNAGGYVTLETDSLACVRVRPTGVYDPGAALVLEDQTDTTGLQFAFVEGYIHDVATPVCGETRVFHLVSRN